MTRGNLLLLSLLGVSLGLYGWGVFVAQSWDPADWDVLLRLIMAGSWLYISAQLFNDLGGDGQE